MHGNITSPNPKFISSVMEQSEYFDEEISKRLTLNTIPRQKSRMHLKNYAQKAKPSSVISDYLIQFLIEPSSANVKLEQMRKLKRCCKNFDEKIFCNDIQKTNWKEHCSNTDSNVVLEHFLQIINKLLDKHAPYIMQKYIQTFDNGGHSKFH